ncbi:MAG: hypothetical protein QM734_05990 [Cyclobacteriaceae bacterium]
MKKLPDFAARNIDVHHKDEGYRTTLDLQLVTNIHMQPGYRHDGDTISKSTLYFFGVIALFIPFYRVGSIISIYQRQEHSSARMRLGI